MPRGNTISAGRSGSGVGGGGGATLLSSEAGSSSIGGFEFELCMCCSPLEPLAPIFDCLM